MPESLGVDHTSFPFERDRERPEGERRRTPVLEIGAPTLADQTMVLLGE